MGNVQRGDYPSAGRYDNPDKPARTILADDTYFYIPQPLLKDIKAAYDRDNGKSNSGIPTSAVYPGNLLADNGIIAVFNEGDGRRNAKGIVTGVKRCGIFMCSGSGCRSIRHYNIGGTGILQKK